MFTSVIPILLVSTIPTLLATIAVGDDAGSSITSASNFMSTMNQVVAEPSSFLPTIAALFHSSPPPLPPDVTTNLQVSSNLKGKMCFMCDMFNVTCHICWMLYVIYCIVKCF